MFGFGGLSELIFIFFLAMLIFGPEKLPEIGRLLAKGMAEVRKASNELKRTLNAELAISEQEIEARKQAALPAAPVSPAPIYPMVHTAPASVLAIARGALAAPPADAAPAVDTANGADTAQAPDATHLADTATSPAFPGTAIDAPAAPGSSMAPAVLISEAGAARAPEDLAPFGTAGSGMSAGSAAVSSIPPLSPYGQGRGPQRDAADLDVS